MRGQADSACLCSCPGLVRSKWLSTGKYSQSCQVPGEGSESFIAVRFGVVPRVISVYRLLNCLYTFAESLFKTSALVQTGHWTCVVC